MNRGLRIIAALITLLCVVDVAQAATRSDRLRLRRPRRTPQTTPVSTPTPTPLETAFIPYWVEDGLARISSTTARRPATTASISAAQNEYEAFQIIARAPDGTNLVGVNAYATNLSGPGIVASTNVTLYREHYVRVTTSSPGSPYAPAEWPDALVPFLNPETGQAVSGGRFPAAPFDIAAGTNQPIFVETYVPAGTAPGLYTGSVVLTARGRTNTEVPVTLRVRSFELPRRSTLSSNFTGYSETSKVTAYFGVASGTDEYKRVAARFNTFLIQHRLAPDSPSGTAPYVSKSTGHITTTESDPLLRHYLDDLQMKEWGIPFGPDWPWPDPTGADRAKATTYLSEMADYLTARGWFQRTYIYLADEPASATAYAKIREVAQLIHSIRPDYRVLVTEQPKPDDPSWGTLDGAVDIWVPLSSRFDEPSASAAMANGDEVWSYTEAANPPAWLIDYPLVNLRTPTWISWRYGQTGLLYWTPWYWEETNPWDNPGNYTVPWGTFNGNGCLIYPGDDAGYTHGPVASLRLKALRDGLEDYEYLKLLSDLGESRTADGEAVAVGTSWTSPTTDPLAVQAARDRIASRIEALIH